MKYRFIKNHECQFPIEKMCIILKIHSSSYYKWKNKGCSNRLLRKNLILDKIKYLYFKFKQRYGSPRIHSELNALGYRISVKTVAKYMQELGLRSKLSKKFRVTTNSKHNYLTVNNLLNRDFYASKPSMKWVSDITYIQTQEGFLYLTTIIDLYDRKVIGWSLSNTMSAEDTTLSAWRMAIKNRSIKKGMLFHSDRGIQYASKKFANTLDSYGVIRSMSRKGNCWDNAVAESFFKSLKTEMIYGNKLITREKMKKQIFQYIEIWYNRNRRHKALNYKTIFEFNNNLQFLKNVA